MGVPTSQNGTSNGNGAAAITGSVATENGPFTLAPGFLNLIRTYRAPGTLMYADDQDWRAEDDMSGDVPMDGSTAPHAEDETPTSTRKRAFGKRMPINREEIVRLMLQGLHDMGYEYVARHLPSAHTAY